ncbi:Txe/YoeB family addiction module toxin [Galbibacter sp. EGI 63066]|uniref:Txe/YoeB family addiction module toxin n=1 Tax=Galbibacter sp. EGI 63066 TaxID=2993559 RepID=UPI002248A152|nr:Txe/YoeB family addiction module toxin [Galbibacter sp. EGI 63066]MCX2679119.1 Txe/YoeB family addiction module toxin [Galbibacter sp. EGI 63066]
MAGKFELDFTKKAKKDIANHLKSGGESAKKRLSQLLNELKEHPETGTGKPERLKYNRKGYWSRRINKKDRLIYKIENHIVTVTVVSAMGHYDDK